MRVNEIIKSKKSPCISLELFPARDDKTRARQEKAVQGMLKLNPDFMSVTFGAGGSTREGSYDLVKKLVDLSGPDIVAYVSAYGLDPEIVRSVIQNYVNIGIETIFCIRGDEPSDPDFEKHTDAFSYASELLHFVNREFAICTGAAGYPEGHKDAVSLDDDVFQVKRKVDNGAEFIISQYFYDNRYFFEFVDKCRKCGVEVPILAGIMPIYSVKLMNNLAKTCGASIPDDLKTALSKIDASDNKAVAAMGIDYLIPRCQELVDSGVDGLHFYTMNKSKSVASILKGLNL